MGVDPPRAVPALLDAFEAIEALADLDSDPFVPVRLRPAAQHDETAVPSAQHAVGPQRTEAAPTLNAIDPSPHGLRDSHHHPDDGLADRILVDSVGHQP